MTFTSDTLISANPFFARSGDSPASNWISPAERYAVVPDETLGPLARRLHQTAHVSLSEPNLLFVQNFKARLAITYQKKDYPFTRGPLR